MPLETVECRLRSLEKVGEIREEPDPAEEVQLLREGLDALRNRVEDRLAQLEAGGADAAARHAEVTARAEGARRQAEAALAAGACVAEELASISTAQAQHQKTIEVRPTKNQMRRITTDSAA